MSDRWEALREYLMSESHDAWMTFNHAVDNGEKAKADIFFTYSVALSEALTRMDELEQMTDEEVAEWRKKI